MALPAGSYIFELADPAESRDIVRVMNRDRSVVYVTAFAERIRRPANWPADRLVTIDEPARAELPRVHAWYPLNTSNAYQFRYVSGGR